MQAARDRAVDAIGDQDRDVSCADRAVSGQREQRERRRHGDLGLDHAIAGARQRLRHLREAEALRDELGERGVDVRERRHHAAPDRGRLHLGELETEATHEDAAAPVHAGAVERPVRRAVADGRIAHPGLLRGRRLRRRPGGDGWVRRGHARSHRRLARRLAVLRGLVEGVRHRGGERLGAEGLARRRVARRVVRLRGTAHGRAPSWTCRASAQRRSSRGSSWSPWIPRDAPRLAGGAHGSRRRARARARTARSLRAAAVAIRKRTKGVACRRATHVPRPRARAPSSGR